MFNIDFSTTMHMLNHILNINVVWGNSCIFNAFKIEKLQRRACKLILGNDYTPLVAVRKHLRILSFEETVLYTKQKLCIKKQIIPHQFT